jgi:hypothetical protein
MVVILGSSQIMFAAVGFSNRDSTTPVRIVEGIQAGGVQCDSISRTI